MKFFHKARAEARARAKNLTPAERKEILAQREKRDKAIIDRDAYEEIAREVAHTLKPSKTKWRSKPNILLKTIKLKLNISDKKLKQLKSEAKRMPKFETLKLHIYGDSSAAEKAMEVFWVVTLEDLPIGRGSVSYREDKYHQIYDEDDKYIWKTFRAVLVFRRLGIYRLVLKELRKLLGPMRSDKLLSHGAEGAWKASGAIPIPEARGFYMPRRR